MIIQVDQKEYKWSGKSILKKLDTKSFTRLRIHNLR